MSKRKQNRRFDDVEIIEEVLSDFEPETELGRELKELALRGLAEGIEPFTLEEVMDYLGRPAYGEEA